MSNRPEARDEEVDDADEKFKDMDEFLDPLADVEAPANAAAGAPAAPRRTPTGKSRKVKRPLIRNLCMDTGQEQGCGQHKQAIAQGRRWRWGDWALVLYCNQYSTKHCTV